MSAPAMDAALRVEDLSVAIRGTTIVDRVSFAVVRGEILAIVGESGCGKSMTALAIMRLLPTTAGAPAGRVLFEGADLLALSESAMREVRGNRISIIFQEPVGSLDPLMAVGDQIVEAIRAHRPVSRAEAGRQAVAMLQAVGISEPARRMRQYPFELSGGMCQRVMIATALACKPSVLLADEPTTALDVTIQAQILELIEGLRAETGTAILLITHDMGVVAEMADRVAVMYAGRIVEQAPVHRLFEEPHHPYTALLLKSVPRLTDEPKGLLRVIDGTVPAFGTFGPGCRFATRCPYAADRCRVEDPPLAAVAPARLVACWYHDDVARREAGP